MRLSVIHIFFPDYKLGHSQHILFYIIIISHFVLINFKENVNKQGSKISSNHRYPKGRHF